MKIDIIVCFCDKDAHHIDHFLECIKRLSFDYELTVMDNRKDTSVDLSNKFTGYNYIIPPSYDGLFESRRYGFNHTHNDFVWYVDIDDEIFDFKLNIQPTDDAVFYNFKLNDLNTNEIHDQRICKFDRLYRIDGTQKMIAYIDQFFMHGGIWNKIFNRKTHQKTKNSKRNKECIQKLRECAAWPWRPSVWLPQQPMWTRCTWWDPSPCHRLSSPTRPT